MKKLTFIPEESQFCNSQVHMFQQVAGGSLHPSLPKCKETAEDVIVKEAA